MPALLRPGGLQALAEGPCGAPSLTTPTMRTRSGSWPRSIADRGASPRRALYRRLGVHGPDRRKAVWLHAVPGGNGPPEAVPGGLWPAPFVWMTNFLDAGACDRL